MNKKILFLIFILCGSFFCFKNAFASDVLDIDNGSYSVGNNWNIDISLPNYLTSFKPHHTNISKINIFATGNGSTDLYKIYICKGVLTSSTGPKCENAIYVASSTTPVGNNNQFIFSPPLVVQAEGNYYMALQKATTGTGANTAYTILNTAPTFFSYNRLIASSTLTYTPNSLAFYLYYSNTYTDSVIFNLPDPTVTSYKDFNAWRLTVSAQPKTPKDPTFPCFYDVKVCVGTTTTYALGCNDQFVQNEDNQPVSVTKSPILTNGNYVARAQVIDYCEGTSTDSIVATTTTSFIIDNVYGVNSEISTQDDLTSHACDNVASSTGGFDDYRYGLECAARKSAIWAFYPTTDSTNYLKESFGTFKGKFPFSAYFGITDTITSAIATSTTSNAGSVKMPMIDKSGHYYMLSVLSSSSMPNLIGQTNYNLFRNSLTWIIWMLMAFLIYIQFKKI